MACNKLSKDARGFLLYMVLAAGGFGCWQRDVFAGLWFFSCLALVIGYFAVLKRQ